MLHSSVASACVYINNGNELVLMADKVGGGYITAKFRVSGVTVNNIDA